MEPEGIQTILQQLIRQEVMAGISVAAPTLLALPSPTAISVTPSNLLPLDTLPPFVAQNYIVDITPVDVFPVK